MKLERILSQITLVPPTQRTPVIVPMRGERQDQFVDRADRALRKRFVDRNSRMSAIMQAWHDSGAESELQERTRYALASAVDCKPDEVGKHFVTRKNRPIFPEHQTTDGNGRVQRYDRQALGAIVNRLNQRILDTGDLSALSAGHTPTAEQQATGMAMPDMVGFSGPFRLGMIGNDKPRWCIFGDEHVFRDEWPRVMKMPRRSPEVWMEPRMEDRILDPIAVLGAETPRLDTGIGRFSRRLNSARYANVARYSYGAAMPGAMNTFTPTHEPSRNSMASASQEGSSDMALDQNAIDEIVSSVLEGITATPQWAYLTDQMGTASNPVPEDEDEGPPSTADDDVSPDDMGGAQPGLFDGQQPGGQMPPAPAMGDGDGDEMPGPDGTTPMPPDGDGDEPGATSEDESGATDDELAQMPPDEKEEYSRLSPSHQYGYMKARRRHAPAGAMSGGPARYSRTERDRYAKIESEHKQLSAEVAKLKAEAVFKDRYSQIRDLGEMFELDVDEEANDCRSMTDAAFTKHLERIQARYSRRDPNGGVPPLHIEPLAAEKQVDEAVVERYSRRAVELAQLESIAYPVALERAKKEILGGK